MDTGKIKKLLQSCLVFFLFNQISFAGTILVGNVISNSVSLINEADLTLKKEIKVGFMPHEVVVSPNGKLALVSNFGPIIKGIKPGHSVTLIDIEKQTAIKEIELGKKTRPHGIKFLSDTEVLVTVQGIQSLLLLDIDQGKILKTLPLPGAGAHMVITDAAKHFAYVANMDSGTVCKIDLKSFSVVTDHQIGKEAQGITLSKDEDLIFVTDRKDNYLAVMRTKDLSVVKTIKTGSGPVRVELFDNGNQVVVANTLSGTAEIIELANFTSSAAFKTADTHWPLIVPINFIVMPNQTTAYVTNSLVNNISLIDLKAHKILKTFKAGWMPDGLAYSQF